MSKKQRANCFIAAIVIMLSVRPAACCAAALSTDQRSEQELSSLENEMMEAFKRGDKATLERLLAEEFILTSATSKGELLNKRQYIGGLQAIRVESFRFHDFTFRFFGDAAIINCRIDWKSTWNGRDWSADFLMTDVWIKRHGRWQIVTRHSSYPAGN